MKAKVALLLLVVPLAAVAGCGINVESRPLSDQHPASARAGEPSYTPPPNLLSGEVPPTELREGPQEHRHEGHGAAAPAPLKPYPLPTCLVGGEELGKMGKPEVLGFEGREIKFCCAACVGTFRKDPAKYLKILDELDRREKTPEKKAAPDHEHEHEEKR
jgi:hypothetical protein